MAGHGSELGTIERQSGAEQRQSVAECRQLVDTMVRTVRDDLALGLRPSMLDDFGLQPALEWHVRDLERRHGVRVGLEIAGNIGQLSERYRTCVYRCGSGLSAEGEPCRKGAAPCAAPFSSSTS